jgi:DNA helicase-2/ATP-dependent DNA helicase PcrA
MGSYKEAFDRLNPAQKKAVTTVDGPVLVIAGPGTGKTQLLTTRVAHILSVTDSLPQNILCLTFTDSAAQTMRERLADMIGQAAYDVTISTYHAFGSDLIRRFPDYFAADSELEPVDDLGIDRIFREIITGLPFANPLKYSDAYLPDIKTLVSDAKRALLSPDDLRAVANRNLSYIQKAMPVTQETLAGFVRMTKKDVPLFETLYKRLLAVGSDKNDTRGTLAGQVIPLATLLTDALQSALQEAAQTGKQNPLTKWKNDWLAKDLNGKFVVDGQKSNQKVLAAADVYEQYLTELRARGLFDYDDMILRAVQALKINADLRYTLQEQYLYILLDEFQDTNAAQLKLVELLTDNPVNEDRPNVLAVGDDDQAIYAFQGAHYSHMLDFGRMYRDVTTVALTQNYRSHRDILHTARGIAEQIEQRLHHHFPAIEKTLSAENKALPAKATIERRNAHSDVMQFAWVAKRIKQLVAGGMPPQEIAVLAPQHKYLVPLVPFLGRAGLPIRYEKRENILDEPGLNQLLRMAELVEALAANNASLASGLWSEVLSFEFWDLPTSLIWQLSWQTNDEAASWTDALLANDRLKPIALFFIRLSQLAATETLETMFDYLIGSTPLDLAEPGYDPFRSPYYPFYFGHLTTDEGWQPQGQHPPQARPSEFEEGASGLTGPPPKSQYQSQNRVLFWDLLTSLIVLRARLRDYKRDGAGEARLYMRDLLDFVEAHRAADLKILNTSPYATSGNAVQLMTAFKAKGLEFQAVFLLAANDEAWGGKARGSGNRISLPPNLQFIRYAGVTNDERLRLFYVALTRAKTQLYLVSYDQNYAGKNMTRLRYLDETIDEQGNTQSPLLPEPCQKALPAEDKTPAPTTELAAYWQHRHQKALDQNDLRGLLHERLQLFQLSPTHVNDFTDLEHSGPNAFFMRTILRFPGAPRPGMQFGSAMHETLEWLHTVAKQTGKVPSKQKTLTFFERRLRANRLTSQQTEQFMERGRTALGAYLAQRVHTIKPDNVAEHSFRGEGVFAGQAHLNGKIDKLIIDRQAKTVTIVDYKTGKSHSRWERNLRLHKYLQQLYLYRALVEGSHTFAGYRVQDAYLEFIEPDEEGAINELHLTFDEAEYQRIKRLAETIWQRIKNLDLPDTSAYTRDLAGTENFEADLLG